MGEKRNMIAKAVYPSGEGKTLLVLELCRKEATSLLVDATNSGTAFRSFETNWLQARTWSHCPNLYSTIPIDELTGPRVTFLDPLMCCQAGARRLHLWTLKPCKVVTIVRDPCSWS